MVALWPTCHGHHFLIIMKSELIKRATEWLHDLVEDAILRGWAVVGYDGDIFGFDIYRNSDPVLAFCDTETERKYSNVRECLNEALRATRWSDIRDEVDAYYDY